MKHCNITNQTPPSPEVVFLRRVSFGVTAEDLAKFKSNSGNFQNKVNAWVEHQLNHLPSDLIKMDIAQRINSEAYLSLGLSQEEEWAEFYESTGHKLTRPIIEHEMLTTLRATYSDFQLFERLSRFWHNHFHVHANRINKNVQQHYEKEAKATWGSWDNTIRNGIMGNFYDLLRDCVEHPAFLSYFENHKNISYYSHTKFSRALFELHTLGTNAYFGKVIDKHKVPTYSKSDDVPEIWHDQPKGYNDGDLLSASLLLTGWRYKNGTFFYDTTLSKTSRTSVFGHRYEEKSVNSGAYQRFAIDNTEHARVLKGRHLLHRIATHPETARNIATKIVTHFISDNPPKEVINAVAKTFLDNVEAPDQLKKCYLTLFKHSAMYDTSTWGQKKAQPFELFIHMFRATGCQRNMRFATPTELRKKSKNYEFTQSNGFIRLLNASGNSLFSCLHSEGYPEHARYWSASDTVVITLRGIEKIISYEEYNFIDTSMDQKAPFVQVMKISLDELTILTPREVVTYWAKRIWQVDPTETDLAPYFTFFCAPSSKASGNPPWEMDKVIEPLDNKDRRRYNRHQWNIKIRVLVVGLYAHPYAQLR